MGEEPNHPPFSPDEQRTLARVLDEVIPPSEDGRLPGAGTLGLVHYLEQAVEKTPDLRVSLAAGLAALDDLARTRKSSVFADLPAEEGSDLLKEFAANDPGFLPGLLFHACVGYYQDDRVVEALGLEARPPHPKGYEMKPNDLSLVEPVRRRRKMYRDC